MLHTILTLLVEAAKFAAALAAWSADTRTLPLGRRPVRVPRRTLDTPTRITVPATGMAMAGWLASGVALAVLYQRVSEDGVPLTEG